MKSNAALYWVLIVSGVALTVFIYLMLGEAPKTVPKITLSYFVDENEIAESVTKRLFQEINQNNFYWIGVEPGRQEQIPVLLKLKEALEKKIKFDKIILDTELGLTPEQILNLNITDTVLVKENLTDIGEKLKNLENEKKPYLLITASIYTNSFLKKNPIHILKEKHSIWPITFSLAYFSTSMEDEKNLLFQCRTEDSSGTSNWGCIVVSKARIVRRKIKFDNLKPWLGLMDLSGEKDYMLLLKKK